MCYKPRFIQSKGQIFPCGSCHKCKQRRASQWSFRLQQELKVASSAYFLTLTYDNQNCPVTMFGHTTLNVRDLQLFYKRLRKRHSNVKGSTAIKHYSVGEYGGHTQRAHYHAIIFNASPELIMESWTHGQIQFGEVNQTTIGYTLKYMQKNKKLFEKYDGRKPEFAVMSNGIGISYLDENMCNWHIEELIDRMYCTMKGGYKVSMPRYYKDKLYFEMEKAAIATAYEIINHERAIEYMEKQTTKTIRDRNEGIAASYRRMELSTKIKI